MLLKLQRYQDTPILSPNPDNAWENLIVTNPGAWYDEEDGEVKLLYRAAGNPLDYRVVFGLAVSKDGYHFERAFDHPAFEPSVDGIDGGGVEDARLVKFGEWYYVTYASYPTLKGPYWIDGATHPDAVEPFPDDFPMPLRTNLMGTCLAMTKDFKRWFRAGLMTSRHVLDHDVLIFPEKINGKWCVIHRPHLTGPEYGVEQPAMWICRTDDLLDLSGSKIMACARFPWEGHKIGGNATPIRTEHGWLLIYHGAGLDRNYRLGAMLLDPEDPSVIIHRTREPIMEPREWYEIEGCHNWKGVVFPCGNCVIGDTFFLYYGGADKYVGLATCLLQELLDYLLTCPAD